MKCNCVPENKVDKRRIKSNYKLHLSECNLSDWGRRVCYCENICGCIK